MKYCMNCGAELPDEALFCRICGAKQENIRPEEIKAGPQAFPAGMESEIIEVDSTEDGGEASKKGGRRKARTVDGTDPYVSKNVVLCTDGTYRWVYEMSLYKDLSIFWLVMKIFVCIILGMGVLFFIIELFGDHNYRFVFEMVGIMMGIFVVLGILGYLLYAAMNGGKFCVLYTMDDKGILVEQQAKQAKKAEIIADLLVLAGALTGNLTTVGMGLSSARRTSMYSAFKGTKKLKAVPKKDLIKMDAPMDHNRIWCEDDEDFNFVWNYIKSRCEGAEITEKF